MFDAAKSYRITKLQSLPRLDNYIEAGVPVAHQPKPPPLVLLQRFEIVRLHFPAQFFFKKRPLQIRPG